MPTPDYFTEIKNRLKAAWGISNFNTTRYAITYGSRDSWTGWRAITWTQTGSLEVVIIPKGSQALQLIAGLYPKYDAVGLTKEAYTVGSFIKDANNRYYKIRGITDLYYPGTTTLICTALDLSYLHAYEADAGATTWTKTRASDPRYRMKVFIDTYVRTGASNTITKDDDSTAALWACIFHEPPYPLTGEFRAASQPVNGLFIVDEPNSTSLQSYDKTTYGYLEHVPVHVTTMNSTACSGAALQWKMEAELRYICETFPFGSLRLMDDRRKSTINLDGMMLYDTQFTVVYGRDKTT